MTKRLVDKLMEAPKKPPVDSQQDDPFAGYFNAARFGFDWSFDGDKRDCSYDLDFDIYDKGISGTLSFLITGSGKIRKCSTSINVKGQSHSCDRLIFWSSESDFTAIVEKWVKEGLEPCLANSFSRRNLMHALSTFCNTLQRSTERCAVQANQDTIASLMDRFGYDSKYNHMGMFDDPRTKGYEFDYELMSTEDADKWHKLADEYDAAM